MFRLFCIKVNAFSHAIYYFMFVGKPDQNKLQRQFLFTMLDVCIRAENYTNIKALSLFC